VFIGLDAEKTRESPQEDARQHNNDKPPGAEIAAWKSPLDQQLEAPDVLLRIRSLMVPS
jgi:hypothetical protein